MRIVYASKRGGKPLNIGINNAKRIARSADKRDQLIVLTKLGPGLPREHGHHQELVKRRHRYYSEIEVTATEFVPHFPHASGSGPRETRRRLGQASSRSDGEVNG